jgi:hypothetical protein
MATTTNYSWSTPDDTALVKDGAAAIRSLGTAIDSTVFTNAGAAINKSLVDAAGDLIYGTADNTVARLAIGTADQVLKVNSGATAPEWGTAPSGGMTLISTTTLSGASTTLSSIPQTYNSLMVIAFGMTHNTSNKQFRCLPNNSTTLSTYSGVRTSGTANTENGTSILLDFGLDVLRTDANNSWTLIIDNYTSTTAFKPINFFGGFISGSSADASVIAGGKFKSNSAVTSLVFDVQGVNTFAGGTVLLYGVK